MQAINSNVTVDEVLTARDQHLRSHQLIALSEECAICHELEAAAAELEMIEELVIG